MNATVVCPDQRPQIPVLAEAQPLPLVPVLGRTLLDRFLESLAGKGLKKVTLKVADRPDLVRKAVDDGARWGLDVVVEAESRETSSGPGMVRLNGLPPGPETDWFTDYASWFAGLWATAGTAAPRTPGAREWAPGVWVGRNCRIARDAVLQPPVWIGHRVSVSAGARIGPHAIVESGAMIDKGAQVEDSFVGPDTYLGAFTHLRDSIAWNHRLVNWRTGATTTISDRLLLARLPSREPGRAGSWWGRPVAVAVGLLTAPACLGPFLRALAARRSPWSWREAVVPSRSSAVRYAVLRDAGPLMARWPQLWNVARGQFAWVGNPPLSPTEAEALNEEYERLWLEAPVGLFSLAEAMGCQDRLGDEARAHASSYAAQRSGRMDRTIFRTAFGRAMHAPSF